MADGDNGARVAAIRAKFAKSSGAPPSISPEGFTTRLKTSKEDQMKAIKIAKERAARYNMTLRALAIQTNQKVKQDTEVDVQKRKEAAERAAKYNMTMRALSLQTGSAASKDNKNIANALDAHAAPGLAKEMVTAVAQRRVDIEAREKAEASRKASQNTVPPVPVSPPAAKKVIPKAEQERKSGFRMDGVGDALKTGDETALNKAILGNFLAAHNPALVGQVDELLDQYSSQLHVLFDKMLKQFPGDTTDASVAGAQKADKEITDAVEEGDVELPAVEEEPRIERVEEEDFEKENAAAEDDDNSIIMEPEGPVPVVADPEPEADEPAPVPVPAPVKKAKVPVAVTTPVEPEDDDEDSIVFAQDKEFEEAYDETIRQAEQNPKAIASAVDRRKKSITVNNKLADGLKKEKNGMVEIDPLKGPIKGGYILGGEMEPDDDEDNDQGFSRWAVQYGETELKKKLGVFTEDGAVEDVFDDLPGNTSTML